MFQPPRAGDRDSNAAQNPDKPSESEPRGAKVSREFFEGLRCTLETLTRVAVGLGEQLERHLHATTVLLEDRDPAGEGEPIRLFDMDIVDSVVRDCAIHGKVLQAIQALDLILNDHNLVSGWSRLNSASLQLPLQRLNELYCDRDLPRIGSRVEVDGAPRDYSLGTLLRRHWGEFERLLRASE